MKKASKYDKMFDAMREVLIEYATAKDAEGRWLHKTPEIMRKFGFGNDPKVIDGFNRWLNRQGIYRCPKPKRSEAIPETLFGMEETPEPEVLPGLEELDVAHYVAVNFTEVMQALNKLTDAIVESNERLMKAEDSLYSIMRKYLTNE